MGRFGTDGEEGDYRTLKYFTVKERTKNLVCPWHNTDNCMHAAYEYGASLHHIINMPQILKQAESPNFLCGQKSGQAWVCGECVANDCKHFHENICCRCLLSLDLTLEKYVAHTLGRPVTARL